MAKDAMHVVIVGGSLAGLMHGITLKRLGYDVTILEQFLTSEREGQAAGIVTLEFSHKYLTAYDLLGDQPYAVPCGGVQSFDKRLRRTSEFNRPMRMSSWNVLYYRLRANFDGFVSSYNPKPPKEDPTSGAAKYDQGKKFVDAKHVGDKVAVYFDDLALPNEPQKSIEADLVIAADGSASAVRRLLQPQLQHSFAGYVAWRGTVLEEDVSEQTKALINMKTTLCAVNHSYIALYTIPGEKGTLQPGKRLLNYVWYTNLSRSELPTVMTDSDGRQHRHTLPIGKMRNDVWKKQQAIASQILPAPFAELIAKTTQPFISAIVDIPVATPSCFNGKLLFVGDALCAFRPHVASSCNQAAYNSLLLAKYLRGEITLSTWEAQVVDFAHRTRLRSVTWGDWYQFNMLSFFWSQGRYMLAEYMAKAWSYWSKPPTV